ncbi:MAG: hypothetical protein IKR59_05730 [Lachnospiraceae bacterium]|nr:hypothetical protein [Lachnospiraceae bacterium]
MITIESSRLRVTIADPNREYNTSRFDRAGFITQVTLDGKYEFCSAEYGGTGGMGLCSEIKFDPLSEIVPVGGKFLKPGVGILTKIDDAPYHIFKTYPVLPFPISVENRGYQAVFRTTPIDLNGYAIRQKKTVTIYENRLRMDYEFENIGRNRVEFNEYVHNFVTLNHRPVDETYVLEMPAMNVPMGDVAAPRSPIPGPSGVYCDEEGLKTRAADFYDSMIFFDPSCVDHSVKPFSWTLRSTANDLSITEKVSFDPAYMRVWTVGEIMSPEVFSAVELDPGEVAVYHREWCFSSFSGTGSDD